MKKLVPVNRVHSIFMMLLALVVSQSVLAEQTCVTIHVPQDDPKVRQPDISVAKKVLDWEPTVARRDGLAKTLEYFKSQVHGVPQV